MIRRPIIVVLMLASLGTSAYWVESSVGRRGAWWMAEIPLGEGGLRVDYQCRNLWAYHISVLNRGVITVTYYVADLRHVSALRLLGWYHYGRPSAKLISYYGRMLGDFQFERGVYTFVLDGKTLRGSWQEIIFPLWAPPLIFAAYPAIAFIRGPLRRRRRRRKGLCVKCGYDLTGNESGVCSECGTSVEPT